MLTKVIKYIDMETGEERSEEASFHLNKADALRLIGRSGEKGFENHIKEVMERGDSDEILDLFESIVKQSYGRRVEGEDGGRTFIKDREEQYRFINSEAYAELLAAIMTGEEDGETFFKAVIGQSGGGVSAPSAVMSGKRVSARPKKKK